VVEPDTWFVPLKESLGAATSLAWAEFPKKEIASRANPATHAEPQAV